MSKSTPSTSKRTPAHRLLQEISTNEKELDRSVWERLGPSGDDGEDLFGWEAVLRGEGLVSRGGEGGGERVRGWEYEGGRWLIEIRIPEAYPVKAPAVRFVTKICHPNVNFQTGEICIDLLKEAWTPAYTIATTLEAIRQMIQDGGEVDSPLNVDLAALVRRGDRIGAEGLVRFFTSRERWEGR